MGVYDQYLKGAKYVDLTHTIAPEIPVWYGFGPSSSSRPSIPKTGEAFTYDKHGFEATQYMLATDQLGTQLDPPAHWAPEYPAIDELPATYTMRPLVVISIVDQVKADPATPSRSTTSRRSSSAHGTIPAGSVVFVRSDWSKDWPDPGARDQDALPRRGLDALKFLHLERHILFHGHEPLDTDTTPTLEGEAWLMHNGYTQAEGVANLDQVPRDRLPGRDRLPEVPGRHRRLCRLRRDLPGRLDIRASAIGQPPTRRCPSRTSPCTGTRRPAPACAEPRAANRTGAGPVRRLAL